MSVQTETRHTEVRKPGFRQEKEVTTTTAVADESKPVTRSSVEVTGVKPQSRRSSFSSQAQQLIPNVSKQQLAYGLPVLLAILLSLAFLGFKSSSYFQPAPPPPTLPQQFADHVDSFAHSVGGEYWEALKQKTSSLAQAASDLADSVPGVEKLKLKAEELKAEADKQYADAQAKAAEYAEQAKEAGAKAGAKAGVKVDNLKENAADAYNRAGLHSAGVAENVKHAVKEAAEAVRHAAAETQEALRHRAATASNTAQHKVQDVKDTVHNIKQAVKEKLEI